MTVPEFLAFAGRLFANVVEGVATGQMSPDQGLERISTSSLERVSAAAVEDAAVNRRADEVKASTDARIDAELDRFDDEGGGGG